MNTEYISLISEIEVVMKKIRLLDHTTCLVFSRVRMMHK